MANLDEIIVLLSKISDLRNTNGIIFRAFEETLQSLLRSDVSDNEFDAFLDKLHNRLVRYSSVFRVYGLRAIRHLLTSTTKVELLYERNIHLIVIESFECDQEYLHERMQAIQLIRKCFAVAPDIANLGVCLQLVLSNYTCHLWLISYSAPQVSCVRLSQLLRRAQISSGA